MDENGEGYAPLIMSSNSLPCIDVNGCEYLGGLTHHPMAEMTNTKNGRAKMHAKLLCWMDQWPTELKGYTKHVKPRHKEHMEYNGMSWGMVNQNGNHCSYLMMQSMSKLKEQKKIIMRKASTPSKLMTTCAECMMFGDMPNLLLLRI
jgi:hypothetical protein